MGNREAEASSFLIARQPGVVAGLIAALLVPSLAGCGSKINEANYYKVQHGMDEAAVNELLGPAHSDVILAASTSPTSLPTRTVKTWSRGGLRVVVVFEDGKVVSRGAEGVPKESLATTRPATGPSGPPPQS